MAILFTFIRNVIYLTIVVFSIFKNVGVKKKNKRNKSALLTFLYFNKVDKKLYSTIALNFFNLFQINCELFVNIIYLIIHSLFNTWGHI